MKAIHVIFVACVLTTYACEDETTTIDVHIHTGCNDEEIEAWHVAVNRLNSAIGSDAAEIIGIAPYGDHIWLVCSLDTSKHAIGYTVYGHMAVVYTQKNINEDRYIDQITMRAMHEIGHLVAHVEHISNIGDVMSVTSSVPPITQYTKNDIKALRAAYYGM